ncbi:MAG: cupin domain-containing protein [Desulfamplus sp.]|nr:cupin domain-containing protein [Desulfamplus sp.]
MGDIWIYGDLRNQSLFDTSLNVLCGAGQLAEIMKSEKIFVMVVSEDDKKDNKKRAYSSDNKNYINDNISIERAIEEAFAYGADKVFIINSESNYLLPEITSQILSELVKNRQPAVFLFPLNNIMREISARCAFICGSGMIADCKYLKYDKGEIVAVCPSHGGEIMAELGFSDPSKTGFITVQPNAFKKELVSSQCNCNIQSRVETISINSPDNVEKARIKRVSISKDRAQEQSLEIADKVVVGGAGVGNIEGFRNLRKLAYALGGQIGATRPPVLWHWTDDDRLIGQTGKTVKPELLITVGTSGAVQYTAGITESNIIVAINKDPNAPIFRFADIGIVEDASLFIPALTDKIHKIAMRSLADTLSDAKIGSSGAEIAGVDDSLSNNSKGSDFGSKLMSMRKSHQLTHEDLAKRTGKNPEFIEELENNRTTPSVGFMIKLSEVFGIDPETFLNEEERAALSGNRAKEYTRRTGNYYYQNLTPGAENEHLRVFMVTIESNKKHKPVAYRHEGEEFIYVMEGNLELTLDGKVHELISGESMKFNSEIPHQLKSLGSKDTRCLVTLYTP